jgi:hypothetical protein
MSDSSATVEQQLKDYAISQAGSRVGRTIGDLLKSDRDRIQFWPGSSAVQHVGVQGAYAGDEELTTMFAAEKYANMRAAIGYVAIEGYPSQAGAWLVLRDCVIDPAGAGRTCLGFLGVELKRTEAALWTPSQRGAVAERGVHGLAV